MSFARAAQELNVTPAALSFQIKSLEDHFGSPLFRRLNRAVELTEAGRALAPGTTDAFQILQSAWRAAGRTMNTGVLTITAGPAFTAKWLAPRLFDFAQSHPEIELRFSASLRLMDFERDDIDIAIRFGFGGDDGPDLYAEKIVGEWMTPMMHPDLVARYPTPEALLKAPLLHQGDISWLRPACDWAAWFRANGLELGEIHGARFSQADHAIDAAQAGAGVVLGRISLTDRALKDRRLVAPFRTALSTEAYYRVLCPKGSEDKPQFKAFLHWLRQETRKMRDHGHDRRMVPAADVGI
jgi:LysR family glycine cleavage system transcriptional activator